MNIPRCNFPIPLAPLLCQVCSEYWTIEVWTPATEFHSWNWVHVSSSSCHFLVWEKDLRSFVPVFSTLLGARALLPDFPLGWVGMFLLSSVHAVFQGKGTAPENTISLTGGLWVPGIRNILVSRPDRRGTGSPVPLAEDVLHSLCMPGASRSSCTLSLVCASPFAVSC